MAEVSTTRQLPAEFIEALGKTYSDQLTKQVGQPTTTTAGTQQPGESAAQWAQRQKAAQQYGITKAGMADLAPQVAGQDTLQTQAATLAGQGIGSYQPYVTAAESALTKAGGLTGADAYKDFMSPYQKDVIDATLQDFDKQAAINRNKIGQSAMSAGAFGGSRHGVQSAEYQSQSDLNRAALQAKMLQQGFGQAQQGAQTAFGQQAQLAGAQQGLGQFLPGAQRADIQTLGAVGGVQQAQAQAGLDASRQASQMAADEPYKRLGVFGQGVTGMMGGMQNFGQTTTTQPSASPLQSALGIGTSLAGIYGALRT
jgi:hypothetical protein